MNTATINELLKTYKVGASILGDYSLLTKEELGNGYCDAEEAGDEILRDAYFAALMIRYWYKIFEWAKNSASLKLEYEDFMQWEVDALLYTLNKKVWRQPGHVLYGDPNGVDKAINQALGTMRGIAYQYWNKDKRRVNVTAASLDAMIDEDGDYAIGKAGIYQENEKDEGIREIIQYFIKSDKVIEALIVDGICYHDTFKEIKTTETIHDKNLETGEDEEVTIKHVATEFNPRMLVKHLNGINQEFLSKYFSRKYSVSLDKVDDIYNQLNKVSNPKLYDKIKKTLLEIQQNDYLRSCLTA